MKPDLLDWQVFQQADWFRSLPKEIRELLDLTIVLCQQQKNNHSNYFDYSFLVFTAGKAYEGFLKYYLLEVKLIDEQLYKSKRFRIGRALNPDVHQDQRDEFWFYDDLAANCTPELAKQIWTAWLECRNRVFHFFPDDLRGLNLEEALAKVEQIFLAIEASMNCAHQ